MPREAKDIDLTEESETETAGEGKKGSGKEKKAGKEKKKKVKNPKKSKRDLKGEDNLLDDESEGGTFSVIIVTTIIVMVWLGILALLIRLDIGGFGSGVLTPILKDVPVISKILPPSEAETVTEDAYGGYTNLADAVEQIKLLELQLQEYQNSTTTDATKVSELETEIERLKTFEANQVEFQRIKTEFYEEVVYSDKGPGYDAYIKYYESMDPTTAEYLYKEAIAESAQSQEIIDYAKTYSAMKPKEAAAIFEAMTDNLDLAARILSVMGADERGKIIGAMDPVVAAKITKIMDPET